MASVKDMLGWLRLQQPVVQLTGTQAQTLEL